MVRSLALATSANSFAKTARQDSLPSTGNDASARRFVTNSAARAREVALAARCCVGRFQNLSGSGTSFGAVCPLCPTAAFPCLLWWMTLQKLAASPQEKGRCCTALCMDIVNNAFKSSSASQRARQASIYRTSMPSAMFILARSSSSCTRRKLGESRARPRLVESKCRRIET